MQIEGNGSKKKANLTVNGFLNSSDVFSKMTSVLIKYVLSPGNCCRKKTADEYISLKNISELAGGDVYKPPAVEEADGNKDE